MYTKNPEFDPEKVGSQSFAAKSLAKWVIAIEKYAIIYKLVMLYNNILLYFTII